MVYGTTADIIDYSAADEYIDAHYGSEEFQRSYYAQKKRKKLYRYDAKQVVYEV
jgi:hypothetical protein